MSNPNDPYSTRPGGHDVPGQAPPPYGAPPQPPYGAPPSGNSKLLIGIIAALVLVIVVGATLFFSGALGGSRGGSTSVAAPGATGTSPPAVPQGPSLPVTTQNVSGSWAEACGAPAGDNNLTSEYHANGDYWTGGTSSAPLGTYRIEGSNVVEFYSGNSSRQRVIQVDHLTTDTMHVTIGTYTVPNRTFRKCAPSASGSSAPSNPPSTSSSNTMGNSGPSSSSRASQINQCVTFLRREARADVSARADELCNCAVDHKARTGSSEIAAVEACAVQRGIPLTR
jgi:hypothetical protein